MTNNPGIYRIWNWCEKKKKRIEPKSGNRFGVKYRIRNELGKLVDRRKTFKTFKEAKDFKLNIGEPKVSEPKLEESKSHMTFGELAEEWKDRWLPHKQLSTQVRYVSYLSHFKSIWNLEVEKINPTVIDSLITNWKLPEYLANGHSTRCSYSHEFSVLKSIFSYYVSRKNRNYRLPFVRDHFQMLKVRDSLKADKDLSLDEFQAFLRNLKNICLGTKWESIFYLAKMQYGIYGRIQEAAALYYEDFDFTKSEIRICRKAVWMRAKGKKSLIVEGAKYGRGKKIPLSKIAETTFKEWTLKSGIRSGLLFKLDRDLIPYRSIEYRYSKALKQAGLNYSATHIVRHASLCEYYQTSRDILSTRDVAGHQKLDSTQRYAKARNKEMADNQIAMDAKLSAFNFE